MKSSFNDIGPGLGAFIATFALVAMCWVLFRSLTKHVRKVKLDEVAQAEAAAAATASPAVDAPVASAADDASGVEDGDGGSGEVTGEPGDR